MIDGLTIRYGNWRVGKADSICPVYSPTNPQRAVAAPELFHWKRSPALQSMVRAVLCSIALHAGGVALWMGLAPFQEGGGGLLPGPVSVTFRAVPVVSDFALSAGKEILPPNASPLPVNVPMAERVHEAVAGSGEQPAPEGIVREKQGVESIAETAASAGARYYRGTELTQRPRPLAQVSLSYPVSSDPADLARSGSIMLRLLIDDTGKVDQVLVEASDLPDVFQELAIQRFSQTRFSPGRIQEQAVRSQMRLEVTFQAAAMMSN